MGEGVSKIIHYSVTSFMDDPLFKTTLFGGRPIENQLRIMVSLSPTTPNPVYWDESMIQIRNIRLGLA